MTFSVLQPWIHSSPKSFQLILKWSGRSIVTVAYFAMAILYLSMVPLSLLACYQFYTQHNYILSGFTGYLFIECVFVTLMKVKYTFFQTLSKDNVPCISQRTLNTFLKEYELYEEGEEPWITGWFLGATLDQITLEDVQELMTAFFYNTLIHDLNAKQRHNVNKTVSIIQSKLPIQLKHRRLNQKPLPRIGLTLDNPNIIYRPLIFYVGVGFTYLVGRMYLLIRGFKRSTGKSIRLYSRTGTSTEPNLVFFHGLGIGIAAYITLVEGLVSKYPNRNILLFEMPYVSMRLNDEFLLPKQFADQVSKELRSRGFTKNILIGHSFGTACVRWMDLFHSDIIHARIFIDPMCFQLFTHHMVYNALYRPASKFHEVIVKDVAMGEAGIATFFHRHFVWFQNTYFTHDLPENCILYLSEDDVIVEVDVLTKYLKKTPCKSRRVVTVKGFFHGQILFSPELLHMLAEIARF
ncbi:hypothetical protein BC833DRAFT_606866 [Globomyces pollinis-pini]|nr:hypothetical protein BC833DRAFT_606866 [Globomyces pollinis-pini]